MEKAFDRLEWNFIRVILSKLGFHTKWNEWVMECITRVSYSLLINDNLEGKLSHQDVLDKEVLYLLMYLFCVEFFGRELLIHSKNPKNHMGIQTHRNGHKIPFLMFVDDCIIFTKASQKASSNINRILHNFYTMSGQLVNFHKSSIQFSNTM